MFTTTLEMDAKKIEGKLYFRIALVSNATPKTKTTMFVLALILATSFVLYSIASSSSAKTQGMASELRHPYSTLNH